MTKPDLKAMPTTQLEAHVRHCYSRYWFEEAADRGYDHEARTAAFNEYCEARDELALREAIREAGGKVPDMIEQLLGLE